MYRPVFKRLLDFLFAVVALIILIPVLIVIFIAVKLDSSGPFFYFQQRLGYRGETFKVFKIRSMTNKKRFIHNEVFTNDSEVTRVGKILRRFKIDELPQIINVLKGDMSLIGPRPCLPRQKDEFDENGKFRLSVRPGLTGLAQVNGNIYLSWPERWKYDRMYVENLSFILDLQILFKTILILIQGEDKFIKKPYV
jgi:lipopolysaccharide/colanic/teichoic acid biosynthesis glycosyltransferase